MVQQPLVASTTSSAAAASLRRISVTCETRLPAACQALADEQAIVGRMLYKCNSQHRRHKHQTRFIATFKGLDLLLESCNLEDLKLMSQNLVEHSAASSLATRHARTDDARNQIAEQLLAALQTFGQQAAKVKDLAKASCAAFQPLVGFGYFVPYALTATAVLGRIFSVSGELCDAVSSATNVLLGLVKQPEALPTTAEASSLEVPLDAKTASGASPAASATVNSRVVPDSISKSVANAGSHIALNSSQVPRTQEMEDDEDLGEAVTEVEALAVEQDSSVRADGKEPSVRADDNIGEPPEKKPKTMEDDEDLGETVTQVEASAVDSSPGDVKTLLLRADDDMGKPPGKKPGSAHDPSCGSAVLVLSDLKVDQFQDTCQALDQLQTAKPDSTVPTIPSSRSEQHVEPATSGTKRQLNAPMKKKTLLVTSRSGSSTLPTTPSSHTVQLAQTATCEANHRLNAPVVTKALPITSRAGRRVVGRPLRRLLRQARSIRHTIKRRRKR